MDPLQIIFGLVKSNFCIQTHTEIRKRECCYLYDNSDKNPKMKMAGPSRLLSRVTLQSSSR